MKKNLRKVRSKALKRVKMRRRKMKSLRRVLRKL